MKIHFLCTPCERYYSVYVSLGQRNVVCPGCGLTRDADHYLGEGGLAAAEAGIDLPAAGAYPRPHPN
jgi:hypothetical protein